MKVVISTTSESSSSSSSLSWATTLLLRQVLVIGNSNFCHHNNHNNNNMTRRVVTLTLLLPWLVLAMAGVIVTASSSATTTTTAAANTAATASSYDYYRTFFSMGRLPLLSTSSSATSISRSSTPPTSSTVETTSSTTTTTTTTMTTFTATSTATVNNKGAPIRRRRRPRRLRFWNALAAAAPKDNDNNNNNDAQLAHTVQWAATASTRTTMPPQQQQQQFSQPQIFVQTFFQRFRPPFLRKTTRTKMALPQPQHKTATAIIMGETSDDEDNEAATTITQALTSFPIFDEVTWLAQTGRELVDAPPARMDALAKMGLDVVSQSPQDGNPYVNWKLYSGSADSSTTSDKFNDDDEAITVWTGTSAQAGYGSSAPWIKTQAILPNASPRALVDLMLDSSRVKTYNSWSTGRQDLWIATASAAASSSSSSSSSSNESESQPPQFTKIVRNRTAPPMGKPLVATTLLHARTLPNDPNSWILVSRAVGGQAFPLDDEDNTGVSEMLLGVNIFQSIPGRPQACRMTALTHVYSSAIPNMLAERLGVKSAMQFVKDMRALSTETTTTTTTTASPQ